MKRDIQMSVNSFKTVQGDSWHALNAGARMTHNIQSNYMVPWKAFKSLPAQADCAVLVCQEERTSQPDTAYQQE